MNMAECEDALKNIRLKTGLTQAQFSQAMGVPLRTYEDLEGGKSKTRLIHINAALYAAQSRMTPMLNILEARFSPKDSESVSDIARTVACSVHRLFEDYHRSVYGYSMETNLDLNISDNEISITLEYMRQEDKKIQCDTIQSLIVKDSDG